MRRVLCEQLTEFYEGEQDQDLGENEGQQSDLPEESVNLNK